MNGYIQVGEQRLHYHAAGKGAKLILAFHGYGNDASLLMSLTTHLPADHILVSIDLPHHGRSRWMGEQAFSKANLQVLAQQVLAQFNAEQLILLGYSIGGRVCLCIAEMMPEKVSQVILMAPDGLRFNTFYYFVTRMLLGQALFKGLLQNGKKYGRWVDRLKKLNILDASRHRFVKYYIDVHDRREKLLQIWPNLRYLIPDVKKVKRNIRQYRIPVHIFMGKHDRIIPLKHATQFSRNMDTVKVHVLDEGHGLPQANIWKEIINCLS